MLVAAVESIGVNHVGHDVLAEFVSIKEEIDQHGLTRIQDFIEVHFFAFDVGGDEIRHDVSAAARGGGDRFLDDFAKVAIRVNTDGVDDIVRVGFQLCEGV